MGEALNSYWLIIVAACVIIISYVFDLVAKKTSVPSVLLLMLLGIGLTQLGNYFGLSDHLHLSSVLELLGIMGLIMIILEAVLDLKLSRDKRKVIFKSFSVALILLLATSYLTAFILYFFLSMPFSTALLYGIPLSIMSSAIIIPSVGGLEPDKKEFMIYEGTFSDILGIIFFYAVLDYMEAPNLGKAIVGTSMEIGLTVLLSIAATYLIVIAFQKVLAHVNYVMIFAVLMLLYAVGKLFHLSSLIIILVFGLIVNNRNIFFRGRMARFIDEASYEGILENFKMFTGQTAFLIRTFFFVVFGMTLTASSFDNLLLYEVAAILLTLKYIIRFFSLKLFFHEKTFPKMFIAPRGLITILLYFSIPKEYLSVGFEDDLIFLVIIGTNVIMMIALMSKRFVGEEPDAEVKTVSNTSIEQQVE